jgi:hypothetical protein
MERATPNRLLGRALAVSALSAIAAPIACGGSSAATRRETTVRSSVTTNAPTARGGGPIEIVGAVDLMAKERCQRESACGRLGPGRRFVDREACENKLVSETRTTLHTRVCETGFVEGSSLSECLDSIRMSGCSVVELTAACEPASLCSP